MNDIRSSENIKSEPEVVEVVTPQETVTEKIIVEPSYRRVRLPRSVFIIIILVLIAVIGFVIYQISKNKNEVPEIPVTKSGIPVTGPLTEEQSHEAVKVLEAVPPSGGATPLSVEERLDALKGLQ